MAVRLTLLAIPGSLDCDGPVDSSSKLGRRMFEYWIELSFLSCKGLKRRLF